jgi:hypothetical protein
MGKIISLAISRGYVLFAYFSGGTELVLKILVFLIVALACIWFGDELGGLTGFNLVRMIDISETTPGRVVRFVGWLLLIVVPGAICTIWLTHHEYFFLKSRGVPSLA